MSSPLSTRDGETHLRVYVTPRASKSRLAGLHGDRLKVQVAAPPVDGAANRELLRTLARALGVARRQITLLRGASQRRKGLVIQDLTEAQVAHRLGL